MIPPLYLPVTAMQPLCRIFFPRKVKASEVQGARISTFSARTIGASRFPGFPCFFRVRYSNGSTGSGNSCWAWEARYSIDQQRERAGVGSSRARGARSSWVRVERRDRKGFGIMGERGRMGIGGEKFVSSLFFFLSEMLDI